MNNLGQLKIALAHDSFTQMGGAERVVQALHELFPQAPVLTLAIDKKFREQLSDWDIRVSPLQFFYSLTGHLKYLLPLIPWATKRLDFSGFDVVISSSSGFVKNITVPNNAIHVCYCHTPPRFLWLDSGYLKQESPAWLRPLAQLAVGWLKKWDLFGTASVTHFVANSAEVQKRINNIYNRDSEIIYPGVDVGFWKPSRTKQNYFLIAGRLQAHKHNQAVIEVFNKLGLPLHVAGTGRQENFLRKIAKANVKFLGRVSDVQLRDEYSGALGFIYPQVEDFGLMPLEAAACGTATLAFGRGGAVETIVPGQTGEFFYSHRLEDLANSIGNWQAKKYRAETLLLQAKKFSQDQFKNRFLIFLSSL